jgi:hypothetical protein
MHGVQCKALCAVQVLAGALTDLKEKGITGPLFEKVQMRWINPKSVTMGQLYGEADRATQEWKDGVLGLAFRQLASDPCADRKWCVPHMINFAAACCMRLIWQQRSVDWF